MTDVTNAELVQSYCRQDSEEAFAELVRRHIGLVHSAALRHVGIGAHAEEFTQAVFIILARKASHLRPGTVLEAWLYETTRFTSLSFLRGERRRHSREQEAYMQSTLHDHSDTPAWDQLAPILDEAMSRLAKKDRDALVLRFFNDKRLADVAAELRVTEAAAQSRVVRAVDKLRKFFSKRGVVLTATVIGAAITSNSVNAAPAALTKSVTLAAAAKGAAASATTLAMINSTLKLMFWAKAKTALAAAAALLLLTGAAIVTVESVHAARAAAAPDIQGAWEGLALLGGPGTGSNDTDSTRVVLKITKSNGVYRATGDGIDLGLKDVPIAGIKYDFPKIRFELQHGLSFNATVNADATAITFDGSPDSVFVRTNSPDTVPEPFEESDYAPRTGSILQGCWVGDFDGRLPVYWKIAEPTDGVFRGELDNPLVGENRKPFSVAWNKPKVTLTVHYGTGVFEGELNSAGTEIAGTWLQRGDHKTITLKRTVYHPEPPAPEGEYTFASKSDLQGHWKSDLDLRAARYVMNVGEMKEFPVLLDIARKPDGTYSSAAVLPLTKFIGLGDPMPAATVQYQPPTVRMEWNIFNAVFSGKLEKGRLKGALHVGDTTIPMTFERSPSR